MKSAKEVILIEELNFLSIICYLLSRYKLSETVLYIDEGFFYKLFIGPMISRVKEPRFKRIGFRDFPGSYYDVKMETGLYANDAFYEKKCNNLFVFAALQFCGDEKYSLALKKELYNRYTYNRVKTHIFLQKISEEFDHILFIPIDSENFFQYLSAEYASVRNYTIPVHFLLFCKIFESLKNLLCIILYPVMLLTLTIKLIINGISYSSKTKEKYQYGIDSFTDGIVWEKPYISFFLYNKHDFHPSKILHVIRNPLNDQATKRKYTKYHFPYAIWNRQKISLCFLRQRIIENLLIGQVFFTLRNLLKLKSDRIFFFPSLAILKMSLETEIFYENYDIKVFISRDEASPLHIIRTLVARKKGNYTVGFMHGDYTVPGIETSVYLLMDRYGVYGEFHKNLNKNGLHFCGVELIGAGIYGLDVTFKRIQTGVIPEKYRDLKKTYRILLIVGTIFTKDYESCFTKDLLIKFYRDVLNQTDMYEDVIRIIKPVGNELQDPDLKDVIAGHERVIIDTNSWIYKLIPISDLTLCIDSTTVGLESILAGKTITYYDVYGFKNHAYLQYSPFLVAQDLNTLKKNLDYFLREGKRIDPRILDEIRTQHGLRFDGRVVHRFRQMCRSLAEMAR